MPRTVPTFAWGSHREYLDALDERRRRSIVRNSRKCCFKSTTCTQLDLANVHSLAGHEISEDNFGQTHQTMASRCGARANVRFGSKTEVFRFALSTGHEA